MLWSIKYNTKNNIVVNVFLWSFTTKETAAKKSVYTEWPEHQQQIKQSENQQRMNLCRRVQTVAFIIPEADLNEK